MARMNHRKLNAKTNAISKGHSADASSRRRKAAKLASDKQKKYMSRLGIRYAKNITMRKAKELISECLNAKSKKVDVALNTLV